MFLDSDYNSNGFVVKSFSDENFLNQSGSDSPLFQIAEEYNVKPNRLDFLAAGVGGCSGIIGVTCVWILKINDYGSDTGVTNAFDDIAKTKNSYDYGFSKMKSELDNAQSVINNQVPYNSDMTCQEYVLAIDDLNDAQSSWSNAPVTHKFDRDLRDRYLAAIAANISEIQTFMNVRDCQGGTSAIDVAQTQQQQAQEQTQQAQQQLASQQAKNRADKVRAEKERQRVEREAEENLKLVQQEQDKVNKRNTIIMLVGAGVLGYFAFIKK